jgi:uncharacterized membrane protein
MTNKEWKMFYVKNVPVWERLLRGAVGAALVIFALLRLDGAATWLAIAAATGLVMSGIFGFCPACAMVGRRLKK